MRYAIDMVTLGDYADLRPVPQKFAAFGKPKEAKPRASNSHFKPKP